MKRSMANNGGQKFMGNVSRELLKLNEDFIPCPVDDGDEIFRNGIFEFNITKMIEFIHENAADFVLERAAVDNFPREFSSINEDHMDSVQVSEPVILAEISPGRYNLIDGNHRMEKARRSGLESLQAYRLNVNQHIKFLISKTAYIAYVKYWNSKR